jgi:hypothetical protein
MSLTDIDLWLENMNELTQGRPAEIPPFMRPCHIATLAATMHHLEGVRPPVPEYLLGYATRMRLWQAIGLAAPRRVREHDPGGRFFPLTPIRTERCAENAARHIRAVFRAFGTDDVTTLDAIFVLLTEILGNCFFHSEAPGGICGLACAQAWPNGRLAQVAVVDSGIGIRRSLSANSALAQRLADDNAVLVATELGVTGKPGGPHSGYGLAVARQLMEVHGGNFLGISGTEAVRVIGGHRTISAHLRVPWTGTIVVLEWRTNRRLDINAVYSRWPSAGESSEFPGN